MTNKDLTKKIRNAKIKRNVFGNLAVASLLFTGYNLGKSITMEAPKNYWKVEKLEQKIDNLYDLKAKINPANDYIPSTQEIKNAYEKQNQVYDNAIEHYQNEIAGLTNSNERLEFQEYEEKKPNQMLGVSLGAILFGCFGGFMVIEQKSKTDYETELENKRFF